jgi:hypothetical protein
MNEYNISATYKKSTYSNEYWENNICGKDVVIIITHIWRWGDFTISICNKEMEELLQKECIIINDYDGEFICTTDLCERFIEIKNIETYSEEEKKAIYESIYENIEDQLIYEDNILEDENGWDLFDTIYEIRGGFEFDSQSNRTC